MTIALVHPPLCDPTMPYVAVPLLTAVLRRAGHDVLPVDANLEAVEHLLRPEALAALAARVQEQARALDAQPQLTHPEQLALGALWEALPAAARAPEAITDALDVLRDRSGARFYDPVAYDQAVATVQDALALVAAAHHPLELDFVNYRTPFAWLTPAEIARDAEAARDPFRPYVREVLAPRLRAAGVTLCGLSVAFPGQLQPAWSLATGLREALPELFLVVGGPAVTQRLAPLPPEVQAAALGPFDAAVLFEGEQALVDLVEAHRRGTPPRGIIQGTPLASLDDLPAPDFDGLPLDRYLAPEPVLPYDASRGCYWNRCAFCHYGLAEAGTARYRARPRERVVGDLQALAARYGARILYLSQDSLAPRLALGVAEDLAAAGRPLRWASDIRPEPFLTPARAEALAAGGCLALSVGVESGAPRVLARIDKGVTVAGMSGAIAALAGAGIAVEAMAFTDFPTETGPEALATLRFLEARRRELALFVCGRFDLTSGARVAREPMRYGVGEIWRVAGDVLGTGLFWEEAEPAKTAEDHEAVEDALDAVSARWTLRPYPWAGSLSTAHTLLWYDRLGPGAFRRAPRRPRARRGASAGPAPRPRDEASPPAPAPRRSRYDVARVAARAGEREARIWEILVYERREVTREAYEALARDLPVARPASRPSGRPRGPGARPRRRRSPK